MILRKTRTRSALRTTAAVGALLALVGCQSMAPAGSERAAAGGASGGMAGGMGCCAMCHGSGQAMQHGAAMHGHGHGHEHGHAHHAPASPSAQPGQATSPAAPVTGVMGMPPVQGSSRLLPQQMAAAGPMCGGQEGGSSCCGAMGAAQGSCCGGMMGSSGPATGQAGAMTGGTGNATPAGRTGAMPAQPGSAMPGTPGGRMQ